MGDPLSSDRVWIVFPDEGRLMEFRSLKVKLPSTAAKRTLRQLSYVFTNSELEASNESPAPQRKILDSNKVLGIRSK